MHINTTGRNICHWVNSFCLSYKLAKWTSWIPAIWLFNLAVGYVALSSKWIGLFQHFCFSMPDDSITSQFMNRFLIQFSPSPFSLQFIGRYKKLCQKLGALARFITGKPTRRPYNKKVANSTKICVFSEASNILPALSPGRTRV